ncbi:uncharacterized protein MONOS_18095 [Monocercomonoides exilis]|uniref:uncharacterized protein n=1 Tax=Monocercomonoides exilis TaxID=2049356 RepID=UPI00355A5D95|nr:hypothetical protein MONOS_18095 [Monocercomonoides exilis]
MISERFVDSLLLPSVLEDEDDTMKECLRWKVAELLTNKKMEATNESAVLSIGMMLWERLTLQIPFGEYDTVITGNKITKGERINASVVSMSTYFESVKAFVASKASCRPTFAELKKPFVQYFSKGTVFGTESDAIS